MSFLTRYSICWSNLIFANVRFVFFDNAFPDQQSTDELNKSDLKGLEAEWSLLFFRTAFFGSRGSVDFEVALTFFDLEIGILGSAAEPNW